MVASRSPRGATHRHVHCLFMITNALRRLSLRGGLSAALLALTVSGCGTPSVIDDPLVTLRTVGETPVRQVRAMEMLDAAPDDEGYQEALHRVIWRPGYTLDVREAAFSRLKATDEAELKRTLRQYLPRMAAWEARSRWCERIAEAGWIELTPALVSSWSQPVVFVESDRDRPEFLALAALHGEDQVPSAIFDLLLTSRRVSQQGLRTRCWSLLHRLGEAERLHTLLRDRDVPADDLFLVDLQRAARELGIVPETREEILWIRTLCTPPYQAFWAEAMSALGQLPEARRLSLEMRDLAIAVAAARHAPDLLTASRESLYTNLADDLRGEQHFSHGSRFGGLNANPRERIYDWRNELTWGDLVAMTLMRRAFEITPVVAHLFDYAERDRLDRSTEYGGVMALDRKGRFEILEFLPRVREHDQKFNAPQAMFDAAYTALAHFHYHVQRRRNGDYAGPGFGDVNYADNTRANCLVFTSVRDGVMNVDFYRHGRVMVDLGTIERP